MRIQLKVMPTLLVLAAAVPIFYIVLPLIHLFQDSSFAAMKQVALDPEVQAACITSGGSALVTTCLALLFGVPLGFLLSIGRFWGKRIIEVLLLLPLILPPVVGGVGELFLYGPMTTVGGWFASHQLPLTNSFTGVVLAQLYITSPFMVLAAKAGFEEVPKELKEATKTLGGNTWHTFWFVSVPLAKRAILAGTLLTFARAVGEFGATMMMAYHPYTLPVEIWVQFSSGGLGSIVPIAVLITVFSIAVALFSAWFERASPATH